MDTSTPKRAVGYIRLSSYRGDADPSTSPARQREACEGYCQAQGWQLVEVIDDDLDESGSDKGLRLDRPGLKKVRQTLRDGRADVVIFSRLDRLARNVIDFRAFADEVVELGGAVVSVEERLDLTTPTGTFVATILAAFAEMEAATIRARSMAGLKKTVALRRWRGGRPPFGYRTCVHSSGSGRGLEIDAEEAEVVREVVRRVLAGASLFAESQRLNAEGTRPRLAEKWSVSSVRAMVTGAHLLGYMKHHGEYVRDAEGMVEVVWSPIITEADHLAVTQLYPPKGSTPRPPRLKASRLLSALVYCASCERRMRVNSNAQGVRYSCHSRADGPGCDRPVSITAESLDAYVEETFLRTVGAFKVRRVEYFDTGSAEAAAIEAAIQHTAASMTEPGADVAELAGKLQGLHKRRAVLAGSREPETRVVETDRTFGQEWLDADLDGRRLLLGDCLDRVVITPGRRGQRGLQADRVQFAWRNMFEPGEVVDA